VLILLPPSEGKAENPDTGPLLDLSTLSFPELTATRHKVLTSLVKLAQGPRRRAVEALGLTPGLAGEIDKDAALLSAPVQPVSSLYTGVLYDALDLAGLPAAARRRADEQLVTFSALFGSLRPCDQVPSYRLSPAAKLPRLSSLPALWKLAMPAALEAAASGGVVLDLRSGPYAALWKPSRDIAQHTVTVRVLHEVAPGKRMVVSHFNKATKGRIVNGLLRRRARPTSPADLADALRSDGWSIEPNPTGTSIDVVVAQI
jgi:cytoplasmic iron level regulating protein YaaA (DUF328/UPF0246 family)